MFCKILAAAIIAAGLSTTAHAQVLASADNGAATVYTTQFDSQFALDGANTTLSFKTTKANEVVEFSFAASRCGIEQTATQTSNTLNESFVQGFFYLDGAIVPTSSGNANTLCYYDQLPQAAYMIAWSTGQMQQRITVPTPGTHTIGVLLQVSPNVDGTNIFPVFGQTHTEVRH